MPPSQQPHVLLVSFPLQGHVNPLLRLGSRLAAKGLLVTFTTFRHAGLRALRHDGACVPVPGAAGRGYLRFEYLQRRDDVSPPPPDDEDDDDARCYQDPSDMLRHVADVGPTALAALIRRQAGAGRPVSCVVNNPFVPWALDVAAGMGVPCGAMLWIQSCAVLSLYTHFYDSPEAFPSDADPAAPVVDVPGLPAVAADELPLMVRPEYARNLWGDMLRAQLGAVGKKKKTLSWVLVNTFHGLERSAIDALRHHTPVAPVGPLLEHDHLHDGDLSVADDGDGCMAWLDAQPPRSVVYVAFGSLVSIGRGGMLAVAEGLVATGRPFLWVVRDELLPEDALAACGDKGRIVAWCPQGRVLGHGAVGCFVTHCGWNSVAEALAAGVPMVGYPWWSDQFTNAKMLVEEYKVGVRLPAPVTRDALRACVDEVMIGPHAAAFRMRATAWKEEATASVADGGSSDRNLQAFVEDVRRSHEKRGSEGGSRINTSGGIAIST
ncbi:unnamed protein product [Urochloa humidicola]